MNTGILSKIYDDPEPTLTTEALDYATLVEASTAASTDIRNRGEQLILAVENEMLLHNELVAIDRCVDSGELTTEHLYDKLSNMANHSRVLVGSCGELTTELETLINNSELTVEEYKKKRRGVIETLVRHVTDTLDVLLNSDTYTSIPKEFTTLIGRDTPRVKKLSAIKSELKTGKLKLSSKPVVSKRINSQLGVYTLYKDKFSAKDFSTMLNGYYELVNGDLITTALDEVHDSLVVSVDNEVHLKVHDKSIKYIKDFKNINHSKVIYDDTKMFLPTGILGHALYLVQLAQNPSDGIIDYSDTITASPTKYRSLEVQMSESEMIKLIELVIHGHEHYKSGKDFEILEGTIVETLKSIRSEFMTAVYGGLFGIFAIKRYIRQVYLASAFIGKLHSTMVNNYQDHSKALVVLLDMATDLRKRD